MPKPKVYESNAERQRAYRERKRPRAIARRADLIANPRKRFRYELHQFVTSWLACSNLTFDDIRKDIDYYALEVFMRNYRHEIGSSDADEWFYDFMENGPIDYNATQDAPEQPQRTHEASDDN